LKPFHECLRVFIGDVASLTELVVRLLRHPQEPTTTVSRSIEDEQVLDATQQVYQTTQTSHRQLARHS